MSKDKKSTDRSDLLDELSSIQSLLGDAAHDVHQGHMDDDIPMLPPEADASSKAEGDAHTQIPLLGEGPAGEKGKQGSLHQTLTERANPFLSQAPAPPARPPAAPATRAIEEMIVQRAERANPFLPQAPTAPGKAAASPAPTLSDAQVRALVDEVLAQWMPRIERELRDRLMNELRDPHRER